MGKQINYWMDYDSFCELATMAVDLGCIIVKKDNAAGRVIQSKEISIVTKDCYDYYFFVPEAGKLRIENNIYGDYIDRGYSETQNAIIEKLAPYIELVDVHKEDGTEYVHKEYVTPQCLELRKSGYSLVSSLNANYPYIPKC